MAKDLKKFFLGLPAVVVIYVPVVLLWLEFKDVPFLSFTWWRYGLAFLFFWGGIFMSGWAYFLLVREGEGRPLSQIPTTKLVKTGPYAIIRNPICSGMVIMLLGEALYFGSLYVLLWAVIIAAVMYYYIVRIEEYRLANKFGKEYVNYKMDVGRFWPKLKW